MKRIVLLLALICCVPLLAIAGKKKSKVVAEPVKPDTATVDQFSYAIGKANTNGLIEYLIQRAGIDTTYMEDFLKGFNEGITTVADHKEKARLAGLDIREQVEKQIIPQISMQVNGTDSALNKRLFIAGFRDGITGNNDYMNISMDSIQSLVRKQMEYYHTAQMESKYGENRRAGEEFLKKNAKEKDVVTTASGLQYKILTKGEGEVPTATQRVKVNYEGKLLDGTVFDSSYERGNPATFGCNQVIKGWQEALTMMPVGSKWQLFIPQELAYGDREAGKIPPFSMLTFTVELLSIEK